MNSQDEHQEPEALQKRTSRHHRREVSVRVHSERKQPHGEAQSIQRLDACLEAPFVNASQLGALASAEVRHEVNAISNSGSHRVIKEYRSCAGAQSESDEA